MKRMKNPPTPGLYRWSRLTSEKWEDAWVERLQFLGPGRAAFIGWPGSSRVRIEAFVDEKTAQRLIREFGGKASKAHDWVNQPARARRPLPIRGRLTVHGETESFHAAPAREGHAHILVPAGMAFGTGDHATTASVLRMLCDVEPDLPAGWSAIDAGCGSGILAIAAAALGAAHVEAFDYDPASVRITRVNARANLVRAVSVAEANVLQWKAAQPAEVVLANLFSDLLIQAAPRLKAATKRRGWLLFSGVLRTQLPEVLATFEKLGFVVERTVLRGKWSAGRLRRP